MSRARSIKLGHSPQPASEAGLATWHVISVKNSTAYSPGQQISKDEVVNLCDSPNWDVTILKLAAEAQS